MDCVCMYRPIQSSGMWYATHACVWRMQLDLLNRVCTSALSLKRLMWPRHLWDRFSTVWKVTLVHLICIGCLWTLTCLFRMTDRLDLESLLHDSEFTLLWIFARSGTEKYWPSPLSSVPPLISFSFLILFALHTFFSHCFYLFFFWAVTFSKPRLFFHVETRPNSH